MQDKEIDEFLSIFIASYNLENNDIVADVKSVILQSFDSNKDGKISLEELQTSLINILNLSTSFLNKTQSMAEVVEHLQRIQKMKKTGNYACQQFGTYLLVSLVTFFLRTCK